MTSMTPETALVVMWGGFALLWLCAATAAFLWAIRSGQFGDQERARSLALHDIPPCNGEDGKRNDA